ncbi:MAG: hypothetical protein ACJAS3_002681 [Roseivirga sp.]
MWILIGGDYKPKPIIISYGEGSLLSKMKKHLP